MIGALWTGISGLASQQTALDNESNNIANVNTIGYKASRVSFADLMYQDSIGKGSSVTKAEKQYTQGSLNLTGSSYDVALNGDGFFVVANKNSTGSSESFYTRAGNFRMGDNGTLQDASGNEVQGWALATIDKTSDVVSTNSNLSSFTNTFTQIAGNKIINFPNKIQTYAAKMSDYSTTSKADSSTLSGSGIKTQSAKNSDIEALITNYSNALTAYATNPEALSSTSIAQSTVIDYPSGSKSTLDTEGDQVYIYVNGNKYTQDYISTTATDDFKTEMQAAVTAGTITTDLNSDGTTSDDEYNVLASRVATYKALADQVSNITGLKAYTVNETANSSGTGSTYKMSTSNVDVLNGTIKIDSIIPGTSFTIGDLSEVSGTTEQAGSKTTITEAVSGSGESAVKSAMEALKDAVAGKQEDVYEQTDITSDDNGNSITFATGDTISFTLNGTTVTSSNTATSYTQAMNDLISKINSDSTLQLTVEAKNINGNLVIESKNTGDEFSGIIKYTDASGSTAGTYTKEKNLDESGNSGAGAEFMQIISTIDQTASKSSLQLKLDSLGLTDSAFGEFSVNSSGVITMKQDGVEYAVGQLAIAQFNNNIGLKAV